MKKFILITLMLITSIANAQDCDPEIQENCSTVFDFACDINPLELTDEEIEAFIDRDALFQALVGLITNNSNVITAVEYPTSTTVFIVKVRTASGSFTSNTSGYGKELILDEMHPQHFRGFYINVRDHAINNL